MSTGTPVPTNPAIAEDAGTLTPGLASQFRRRLNEYVGSVEDKVQVVQAYVEHHIDVHGYGALAGGTIAPGTGLSVTISPYEAVVGNYVYYDGTVTLGDLAANNTNYIYLHQDGTFEANVAGTVPAPSVHGPAVYWGYAQTDAGSVVAVSNLRPAAWRQSVGTITLSGGTITPVAEEIACSHLTLAGTPSGTVLLRMPVQYGREWHVENATSAVVQLAGTVGGTALIGPGGAACVYCGADGYKRYTGTDGYIVVAASNAPSFLKQTAHFVCDGVDDQVEIQAAINSLSPGGIVELSPGTFTTSGPIQLRQGIYVRGQGMAATYIAAALGHPFDLFQWRLTPKFTATASGGSSSTITFAGDVTGQIAVNDVIRIKRGTGFGQKRTVTGRSYASGTTTVTVTPNWSTTPDSTSVAQIDAEAELFGGLGWLYATGKRKRVDWSDGNDAYVGTVHTTNGQDAKLVDSAGRAFPSWVVGCSVHIYSGNGLYETRYIEGLATTNSSNDTLLLDGPWWTDPAGASYVIAGHGVGIYGSSCYDFQLDHIWFTQCTGFGVYTEHGWGHCYYDLISEFNDLGGVMLTQSPLYAASTASWGSSTGQIMTAGPKFTNCKILANGGSGGTFCGRGGHGILVFGRVYDGLLATVELGSSDSRYHGLAMVGGYGGGPKKWAVSACRFGSFDNVDGNSPTNAGVYFGGGALSNTICGCAFSATAAGPKYAVRVPANGGQGNVVVGNIYEYASGMQFLYDQTGWNLYSGNLNIGTTEQDSFCGIVSGAANANGEVTLTFPAALVTVPTAADLIATFSPKDATTAAVSGWYVSALSNTAITIKSPSAVSGTIYSFYVNVAIECRRTGNG